MPDRTSLSKQQFSIKTILKKWKLIFRQNCDKADGFARAGMDLLQDG